MRVFRKIALKKRTKIAGTIFIIGAIWFVLCLPSPLFEDPTSTVLEDSHGKLLAAKIADDGQWRFPVSDTLPAKFVQAITHFEDEYFFKHPGVNPVSIFRAMKQNIKAGRVVSGGSTISMQTIRLSRKGQGRTVKEKLIEVFQALRMECSYTKDEILNMYASYAPFGGNVVGLEAAAWRYYGRSPYQLSWGETCTMAVLPNAPSLIYPGKNQERLVAKRNRLLDKLKVKGIIDEETCELAKSEPLPGAPYPVPQITPHLLHRAMNEGKKGERVKSSIESPLQEKVNDIVNYYHAVFSENEIYNLAALVLDVETGEVMAYTGNTNCNIEGTGKDVDIITSPRSTGSILKPILYNFMLDEGTILPHSLVSDIPTQYGGFSPKNFHEQYDGVVPASNALSRSLNIPAVRMLKQFGLENFHHRLKKHQFSSINRSADHYGLSIILGGAEATLWDLCNEYMRMAQTLNLQETTQASYSQDTHENQLSTYNAGPTWWTFEALSALNRPLQEYGWQDFQSSKKIAWKTGTSFGHRDAWAIGVTPKHVVGIWVGNADGEGRPGLTGLSAAAPVMFKIFKHLDYDQWFEKPIWDLKKISSCQQSGYLASSHCEQITEESFPVNAERSSSCPYHQKVHLDKSLKYRVNTNCQDITDMASVSWFALPPIQEWYYKKRNPHYKPLPPIRSDCMAALEKEMDVVYPKNNTKIFVPRDLDGSSSSTIFEVAHRNPESVIYWHINDEFVAETSSIHRIELAPPEGRHEMTIVDEYGESLSWNFEILGN